MDDEYEPRVFRLIVPMSEVPVGATVTKRTGTKLYRVEDKFNFWPEPGAKDRSPVDVTCKDGCRFIMPLDHSPNQINVLDSTTEVVWHATEEEMFELLEGPCQ